MTDSRKDFNFRGLFYAAADAMLLADNSGRIVLTNLAAQLLFGYTEAELCGQTVETLMPPRYRKQHRRHREFYFNKPEKRAMGGGKELAAQSRDGKELMLDISLSPIKEQEQLYVLITFNLVDQRLEAEKALRASEERFRLVKQAAGLCVFDCDCERKTIYWDEQIRRLWGGDSNETLTYGEFMAMIHPEDRAARQAAYDQAIDPASNGKYNAESRVINPKNGDEHWIATVGRVYFETGRASRLIGIVRDVTEQKNIEKKLQAQRAETEALFKQQVAVSTASAIAHELNQPLAAISAYSEVAMHALHNDAFNTDKLSRALEGCVEQTQRAGRSLHELLAFLQKGELVTEKLNLNDIVKESLNIVCNDGYGGFYPVLHLEQNSPAVQGNHTQVQKVLVNLIRNAVEAMRAAKTPIPTITITAQTLAKQKMVMVIVQDSGPGLDQETAKRIFEPFFTTKSTGIGMGLAISRALVEANGGRLWVKPGSTPGTKFHFTLPVAP
ncbi:MAG TPA: PAS domain S-box protein [Nitrosomonas nitrosa]|nr:PAS domain S-box protein [Nitrosomonas nitrosa]